MRLLVIGSGGREHAICAALARSPSCDRVYCAPGNDGIALHAHCVVLSPNDYGAVVTFCRDNIIDCVVVGPEAPLVGGLADCLRTAGIAVVGPNAAAARLEGSKAYMKACCHRAGVRTAPYAVFDDASAALACLPAHGPVVVKADGLAGGKGTMIAADAASARRAVTAMLIERRFGDAGKRIVVEQYLVGREASVFCWSDGRGGIWPLAVVRDYKRLADGDQGPNTGGMGAVAVVDADELSLAAEVTDTIARPLLACLGEDGVCYQGVLYCGVMQTGDGIYLLECNVRFGDPEAQALLPLFSGDFASWCHALAVGGDAVAYVEWRHEASVAVTLVSKGYPDTYCDGGTVSGLSVDGGVDDALVYHATLRRGNDSWYAGGGRVCTVVATGQTVALAKTRVYAAVRRIHWSGMHYRHDIGHDIFSK